MSLNHYLKHRRLYEATSIGIVLTLIASTNATSKILEMYREGSEIQWADAIASEFTAIMTIPILFPLLFPFLKWVNLNADNLRWRVLWHIPGFLVFSLLHITLFVTARELLWAIAGFEYEFGPIILGLIYELRKLFWVYLAIVIIAYSYRFIITRLQGEAKFIDLESSKIETPTCRERFLVKMLNKEFLVHTDDIRWIQSAGNYVLLKCGDREYPMRQTLKSITGDLDPRKFMRVHRTAIVNLDEIVSIKENEMTLQLASGESIPISKRYLEPLRQILLKNT